MHDASLHACLDYTFRDKAFCHMITIPSATVLALCLCMLLIDACYNDHWIHVTSHLEICILYIIDMPRGADFSARLSRGVGKNEVHDCQACQILSAPDFWICTGPSLVNNDSSLIWWLVIWTTKAGGFCFDTNTMGSAIQGGFFFLGGGIKPWLIPRLCNCRGDNYTLFYYMFKGLSLFNYQVQCQKSSWVQLSYLCSSVRRFFPLGGKTVLEKISFGI